MLHEPRVRAVLWFGGLLLLTGCAAGPRGEGLAGRDGAETSILYDTRMSPKPLTAEQRREILADARSLVPPGQGIWYVLVRGNFQLDDGRLFYEATVLYTPHFQGPRVRKGKCLYASSWQRELRRQVKEKHPDVLRSRREDLPDYWQVSSTSEPFGEALQVPAKLFWPFSVSAGLTNAQVVEVADFIRAMPRTAASEPTQTQPAAGLPAKTELESDEPILSIARMEDEIIEVRTGTVQGPLAGKGHIVRCAQKDTALEILSVTVWEL